MACPATLVANDPCFTCRKPGAWIWQGCPLLSGTFVFGRDTPFHPAKWRGQIKHFMKCNFLANVQAQPINQDHILRGVILEAQPAIFWVGADGSSMLEKASSHTWGKGQEKAV